jgi:hypothetical protein
MSAYDPERLEALASAMETPAHPGMVFDAEHRQVAAALRAFAQVVRVLERVKGRWELTVEPTIAYLGTGDEMDCKLVQGDTPLAAVIALAEALAKEGE